MDVARDVAIIVLAVESIVVGILLVVLTIQVYRLVTMLRDEIKPIIDATQETVGTVRGTTTFLSEHVVTPVVNAASFVSGLRRAAKVITGFRSPGRHEPGS